MAKSAKKKHAKHRKQIRESVLLKKGLLTAVRKLAEEIKKSST